MATALSFSAAAGIVSSQNALDTCRVRTRRKPASVSARFVKPVEERYNIRVERNVSQERLDQLGVSRWSKWESGKCELDWVWHVDEQVYIVKGSVKVVPEGCEDEACFNEGDLVRYPKWLEADLYFQEPYEQRYRFLAYGDD
eukprot:Gb_38487 [translate_table: standard]